MNVNIQEKQTHAFSGCGKAFKGFNIRGGGGGSTDSLNTNDTKETKIDANDQFYSQSRKRKHANCVH